MTHHRTYRVTVSLARVSIRALGEPEVTLEIPDGTGQDQGLDMALDHLLTAGRRPVCVGPAPRTEAPSLGIIRTEYWLVVTLPVEPTP